MFLFMYESTLDDRRCHRRNVVIQRDCAPPCGCKLSTSYATIEPACQLIEI